MAEFFLELFSEEIPARLQAPAADALLRGLESALAPLAPTDARNWHGPRRIAAALNLAAESPASRREERGPRIAAPEAALAGFLRKHGAAREAVVEQDGYWVLRQEVAAQPAAALIASALPTLLRRFSWPKSMRWGGRSGFVWVRPLRRIVALLDGAVVAFSLAEPGDDAHGLASGNLTEGHRMHAPGPVAVQGAANWEATLAARQVIADAAAREARIATGLAALAEAEGLRLVADAGLLTEVAGLVEWPVPLLGRIDDGFMDLPPEVMQVSMRVNQRYFALRTATGAPAPHFAFVANIDAADQGRAVIAGNERVLRARFADARHFWDLDRRTPLADRQGALAGVVFHARLGTQAERVARIAVLAELVAPMVGADGPLAARAANLAKADLTSGMVGEFPELQGVMGRYYALHDGEPPALADAIRDHYAPRGAADAPPAAPLSVAVALADRLDMLAGFFAIGERPGGSGDPYALRRAGLGIVRIVLANALRLDLDQLFTAAIAPYTTMVPAAEFVGFLRERLRVQLRAEGMRHDVLDAVLCGPGSDLVGLVRRAEAVASFLASADGTDLLAGYRRAANILRIEDRKDGPHQGTPDQSLLSAPAEQALAAALEDISPAIEKALAAEDFAAAMVGLAGLRGPLDEFFVGVTVNDPLAQLRRNRLLLLHAVRCTMDRIADFSRIEGQTR